MLAVRFVRQVVFRVAALWTVGCSMAPPRTLVRNRTRNRLWEVLLLIPSEATGMLALPLTVVMRLVSRQVTDLLVVWTTRPRAALWATFITVLWVHTL